MLGDDGLDAPAERDQLADQVGDSAGSMSVDHEPVAPAAASDRSVRARSTSSPPRPLDLQAHLAVAAEQFGEAPGGHGAPVVDHRDAVAHVLGLLEQVGVEEHGRPPLAQTADDLPHVVAPDGIERARGLVEHDQRGVAEQRHAEPEPLLHSLGERADAVGRLARADRRSPERGALPPPRSPWAARAAGSAGAAPRGR